MAQEELKQQIRTKYLDFIEREYQGEVASDERHLDLMYTQVNDDEVEVQCSYDLEEEMFIVEITQFKEKFIHKEYDSLTQFNEELDSLTFEGLYSYVHQICEEKFSLDLEW